MIPACSYKETPLNGVSIPLYVILELSNPQWRREENNEFNINIILHFVIWILREHWCNCNRPHSCLNLKAFENWFQVSQVSCESRVLFGEHHSMCRSPAGVQYLANQYRGESYVNKENQQLAMSLHISSTCIQVVIDHLFVCQTVRSPAPCCFLS